MILRGRRPLLRAGMVGGVANHARQKVQQGREAEGGLQAPEKQQAVLLTAERSDRDAHG